MKSGSSSSFRAAAELPDREDESMPRSMPESPKPGERFALEHHPNSWTVYDWIPAECRSCCGAGKILERDTGEPERKCLDCRGTGSDHEEPEEFARWMSEADASLLVFGLAALEAAEPILNSYIPADQFDGHAAEALRLVSAALAQAKGESK